MDDNTYDFDLAKAPQTIIKVIGVAKVSGMYLSCYAIPIIRRCRSRRFLINC